MPKKYLVELENLVWYVPIENASQKSIVEKIKGSGVKISKTAVFNIISSIGNRRNYKLVGRPSSKRSQPSKVGKTETICKAYLMTNKETPPSYKNITKTLKVSKTTVAQCFAENYNLGQALRSLRNEGVLIVGSGSSTHNLREMREYRTKNRIADYTNDFETELERITRMSGEDRKQAAIQGLADSACLHKAHPTLEHIVPFHVALGAAGNDPCEKILDDKIIFSLAQSAFIFGESH